MKISKYVFIFPCEESGNYLFFNSGTGSLITIDERCFCDGKLIVDKLNSREIKVLQDGGYLIDDDQVLSYLESAYYSPSDTLMLCIEVTGRCNLACSYCYQSGWAPRNTIKDHTIDKIASYIEKCISRFNYKAVKIDFIGGEPLLAVKDMIVIFSKLKEICQRRNVELQTQVETNGTLINPEQLRLFDHLDLCVTLSLPEDHNRFRTYKNGEGSYSQIISNLIDCKKVFNERSIKLTLRYNVHAGNYQLFGSFLTEIKRLGLPVTNVKTAYTSEYEGNDFQNGLTWKEFLCWNSSEAVDILAANEYPVPFFPHAAVKRCEAYQPYNCKVFYDGSIGLCNASRYGSSSLNIEQIEENPDILNEYYKEIKSWNPLHESDCRSCEHLLLCGGKTFCRDNPCNYAFYDLEVFLKKYVQYCTEGREYIFAMD